MDGEIFVNMISFSRVYQIKITHLGNFQEFDLYLYLIYLAFNFILKCMRRADFIKTSLKEMAKIPKSDQSRNTSRNYKSEK
jgi:hypothetical protein